MDKYELYKFISTVFLEIKKNPDMSVFELKDIETIQDFEVSFSDDQLSELVSNIKKELNNSLKREDIKEIMRQINYPKEDLSTPTFIEKINHRSKKRKNKYGNTLKNNFKRK